MKAEPAVQRRLLDLADADAELGRIDHRRRTLPELALIEEAEKTLQVKRDAVVAAKTAHKDLSREITKQEDEIEAVRARRTATANCSTTATSAPGRSPTSNRTGNPRQAADRAGRRSARTDGAAGSRRAGHPARAGGTGKAEETLADARQRRDQAVADLDVAQARRVDEREKLVPGFPADLLALYERVRAQKGIGAGLLRARRCGACRMELDRSAIATIRDSPADEVVRCEECGAILVRTAESGL